jgi:hypothetical protein
VLTNKEIGGQTTPTSYPGVQEISVRSHILGFVATRSQFSMQSNTSVRL